MFESLIAKIFKTLDREKNMYTNPHAADIFQSVTHCVQVSERREGRGGGGGGDHREFWRREERGLKTDREKPGTGNCLRLFGFKRFFVNINFMVVSVRFLSKCEGLPIFMTSEIVTTPLFRT